jgi:hypothetical protein
MDDQSREVVLQGTVTSIEPAQGSHPHRKWRVSVKIDAVLEGRLEESTLVVSVHSPTKLGIERGGRCLIRATRADAGEYTVTSIIPWSGKES